MINPSKVNEYNVVLICRNSDGAPTSYPVRVACTAEQHDEVEYLDDVCEHAEANGFIVDNEIPVVVNHGDPLWEAFSYVYDDNDWQNAPLVTYSSPVTA